MVTVPSITFSSPSSHLLISMLTQQQLHKMQFQTFIIHLLQTINRIKLAPDVLCTSKAICRSVMKYQYCYLSAVSMAIFSDRVTCKRLVMWTYSGCHVTERPSGKRTNSVSFISPISGSWSTYPSDLTSWDVPEATSAMVETTDFHWWCPLHPTHYGILGDPEPCRCLD